MPHRDRCLDDVEVYALTEGEADDERRARALEHVERCDACRALLGGVFSTSELPAVAGYRFIELLAEGGMGRIYRAVDVELGREVAIKVPRSRQPALLERFEREVAITARLQHPGIVPLHGAGTLESGTPFYVMRFVDGIALDEALAAARDPAARHAYVRHVLAVAEAMAYAHREGIAHRDLKPSNVLVSTFGEALLIDWGLAKVIPPAGATSRGSLPAIEDAPRRDGKALTWAGDVFGTPGFMAPEQAAGEVVDERVDVYALGALLRYVVTGAAPGEASDETADGALVAIWRRALAADPAARFADAGELAIALRAALEHRPAPRSRWWLGLGVALVAVALGLVVLRRGRDAAPAGWSSPVVLAQMPADTNVIHVSPSGELVSYRYHDRLEVRDLATGRTWGKVGWPLWPSGARFVADDVVELAVTTDVPGELAHARWRFATDELFDISPIPRGWNWEGRFANGRSLMEHRDGVTTRVVVGGPDAQIELATFGQDAIEAVAFSPSGHRAAFLDALHPQRGVIRVVDEAGRSAIASPVLEDPSALTWIDDDTLLYATGTTGTTSLFEATASAAGLAAPRAVYTEAHAAGWFGGMGFSKGRLVTLRTTPQAETQLIERRSHDADRLDPVAVSAPLGWRDGDSFYAWNRGTGDVELRPRSGDGGQARPTGTRLREDPANATFADGTLIVALRSTGGRRIEAYRLGEAAPRWTKPAGTLEFVRCAADVTGPCVAGVVLADGRLAVHRLDPDTGAVGEALTPPATIYDAALDRSGAVLAWSSDGEVRVRSLAEPASPSRVVGTASVSRSLAFVGGGGLAIAQSDHGARSIVICDGDALEPILTTSLPAISLVRPSPDGEHLLYRTRTFVSELVQMARGPR